MDIDGTVKSKETEFPPGTTALLLSTIAKSTAVVGLLDLEPRLLRSITDFHGKEMTLKKIKKHRVQK